MLIIYPDNFQFFSELDKEINQDLDGVMDGEIDQFIYSYLKEAL